MTAVASMTGVGVVSGPTELGEVQVELRSVNARGLQIKSRLGGELQGLENALEARCRARLQRGTVTALLLHLRPEAHLAIDLDAAEAVAQELRELAMRCKIREPLTLRDLLTVPGLSGPGTTPRLTEMPEQLGALVDRGIDALIAHRESEGAATATVMREHLDELRALAARAAARAPEVAASYRERLLQRVNEFLTEHGTRLEAGDVVREVGVYADRTDISEELQRLEHHVGEMEQRLQGGGAIGRALEFLLQEALREANTMGSKSPDVELSHIVVELKTVIDRLKEQAANLE